MLLSLFPQAGKDIPAIASASALSTSHNIPLTDVSKESGAPTSIGRITFATLASYLASVIGFKSTSASAGVGYATGAGGAVPQGTGRTTGVTLNTVCGAITLVSAAGSATPFSFTLTNSTIAATDTVIISQKSGTDKYTTQVVTAVAAGSCQITLANASGTTTEQPVFNFAVIKAVAA
jgi:hypothetical protein